MAELATIARPYAEALFQSAKPAELASFMEQLGELAQLAVLPEIASLSNNPKVSADDFTKLLSGMVKTKLDGKTLSFLSLVNQNHRLAACLLYTSDAADESTLCRSRWSPYH